MGQELTKEEEKARRGLVSAAGERELNDWKKFKVFRPVMGRASSKSAIATRRGLMRKMVDGRKDDKA